MADEPERRLVGVIHAELEKQAKEAGPQYIFVDRLASDGTCQVAGPIDLYLLAQAILKEQAPCTCARILRGDLEHRCTKHPEVKPKTRTEQAAFANAWDAKVERDRNA